MSEEVLRVLAEATVIVVANAVKDHQEERNNQPETTKDKKDK